MMAKVADMTMEIGLRKPAFRFFTGHNGTFVVDVLRIVGVEDCSRRNHIFPTRIWLSAEAGGGECDVKEDWATVLTLLVNADPSAFLPEDAARFGVVEKEGA